MSREVFRIFDVDGTRHLTIDNFRDGLRSAGLVISDKDAALVFNAMAYHTMKPKTPQHATNNSLPPVDNNNGSNTVDEKTNDPANINQTTVTYFQFYSFFEVI